MLYVIDTVLLIGCILVLSAGIVWAFRSDDYSKHPLHRLYNLLSGAYLRMCELLVNGCDALQDGKNQLCEKLFGSCKVSLETGGGDWKTEQRTAEKVSSRTSGFMQGGKYNMKVLK